MVTFRKPLVFPADAIWLVKAAIRSKQKKYEQWGGEKRGVGCGEGFLGLVTKGVKSFAECCRGPRVSGTEMKVTEQRSRDIVSCLVTVMVSF